MGLEVETVEEKEQRKPVADYVLERDDGDDWEEWLQTHRVELNAMTTPQFIAWLDGKMAEHGDGKLIPPQDVLEAGAGGADREQGPRRHHRAHPARGRSRRSGRRRHRQDQDAGRRHARTGHREAVQAEAGCRMARPHRGGRGHFENLSRDLASLKPARILKSEQAPTVAAANPVKIARIGPSQWRR